MQSSNVRRVSSPKSDAEKVQATADDITSEIVADIKDSLMPQFWMMVLAVEEAFGIVDENHMLPSERFEITLRRLAQRQGRDVPSELRKVGEQRKKEAGQPPKPRYRQT